MPKFTLICDHSYDDEVNVVTHEFTAEILSDVLMNLDMFLRGSGYVYDGELEISEPAKIQANFTSDGVNHADCYFDFGRNR